jgi:arsenite methyltransferase
MSEREQEVKDYVRERYGSVARAGSSCCGGSSATIGAKEGFAEKIGYDKEDLNVLPEGANLGLSCGNPVALASLKEGEVVIDLGSGGGFDCFIAGRRVGAAGRIIGIDMTPDMISRARKGIAQYRSLTGLDNVEFRLGEIEHLPVADASVDVVISNCVLNLSPEKPQVWREIARVLKPGGRVAVSDVALLKPIPRELEQDLRALSLCLSGAVTIDRYIGHVEAAGLTNISVEPVPGGGEIWESYQDPILDEIRKRLPAGSKIGDYAASVRVSATKGGVKSGSSGTKMGESASKAGAEKADSCCETAMASMTSGKMAESMKGCC